MSILMFSDTSGSFDSVMFSEQIAQFGEILLPGSSVILDVHAETTNEGVRLRLVGAKPVGNAALSIPRQLRIYVNDTACLAPVKTLLSPGGNGTVVLCIRAEDRSREYQVQLPGKYLLNRDVAGGVKSISGVNDANLN